MTDNGLIATTPRQVIVDLVVEALKTAPYVDERTRFVTHEDIAVVAGMIKAFLTSAAIVASRMYGTDREEGFAIFLRGTEGAHMSWSDADLLDAKKVRAEAGFIVDKVIGEAR